jgi:hypothetical protein
VWLAYCSFDRNLIVDADGYTVHWMGAEELLGVVLDGERGTRLRGISINVKSGF